MRYNTLNILGYMAFIIGLVCAPSAIAGEFSSESSATPVGFSRDMPKDDRPDPMTNQQRKIYQAAMIAKVKGWAHDPIHQVAKGQFVELERQGEDRVLTILGEFNDYPHNSIPEPDRNYDNTTIWRSDFSHNYYMEMLFGEGYMTNSMRNYFIEQSSNRYAISGDVTEWLQVKGNSCDYDDGMPGPGSPTNVWQFLIDSLQAWYDAQIAAGKSLAEIDAYLSQFDVWDRYDWDGDGKFDEPDGYIDRIQFVHSGEGNECYDNALGDCAIWSHSWYAYYWLIGYTGPSPDHLMGGIQIGQSSYWVNKYTIMPENGGVGVFAHEYGHDLNLPDLYDTSGIVGLIENSTGYWSLMSAGSFLSDGVEDIGSKPGHLSAWEKFQLGWLNYEVAFAGQNSAHKLGPAETNTKQAQGLFVILPDKEVTTEIADPHSGSYFYYSGSGNNLSNFMYRSFNLQENSFLKAWVNFDIESGYDYAYAIISTDGGATWQNLETNLSTTEDPAGQNFGYGITGLSGGWEELTANLSNYEGNVLFGFYYYTDSGVVQAGFMIDDITITGYPVDDAETDTGWTLTGFRITTGTESANYFNAYIAEFRQYYGYDENLAKAYAYGWYGDPVWGKYVEHFPYQDGLLISYWDTSFEDNAVFSHCNSGRCGGVILPIDAHPEVMYCADGSIWPNRMQSYDSTFGLEPTDSIALHWDGELSYHPSQPAVPMFDDRNQYWNPDNPWGGVINPHTGTKIVVKSLSAQNSFMQVLVQGSN